MLRRIPGRLSVMGSAKPIVARSERTVAPKRAAFSGAPLWASLPAALQHAEDPPDEFASDGAGHG